jgi:hypothetical protein
MRAAPILEITGALEGQLVLQITFDELVVFDELAIEARRRELRIPLCDSASVHTQAFLWKLIMTRPAGGICEMIGKRSAQGDTGRPQGETAVTNRGRSPAVPQRLDG